MTLSNLNGGNASVVASLFQTGSSHEVFLLRKVVNPIFGEYYAVLTPIITYTMSS
jgi:hypothetical protein